MFINYEPKMVSSFELGKTGGIQFCLYPSRDCMQLEEAERIKHRILTIEFSSFIPLYQFITINYVWVCEKAKLLTRQSAASPVQEVSRREH